MLLFRQLIEIYSLSSKSPIDIEAVKRLVEVKRYISELEYIMTNKNSQSLIQQFAKINHHARELHKLTSIHSVAELLGITPEGVRYHVEKQKKGKSK